MKILKEIMSSAPVKKKNHCWSNIAAMFAARTGETVDEGCLRNKWNQMNKPERDLKLLKHSSGIGPKLEMMDPELYQEFTSDYPSLATTNLAELSQYNEDKGS